MIIGATEPQMRRVQIAGASRPVYRVGTTNEWEGVRWLSWNAAQLSETGLQLAEQEYPIYVQSHALRQLHRRVNLPAMARYREAWRARRQVLLIPAEHLQELLVAQIPRCWPAPPP
jgi:hypothetical protein